MMPRCASSPGQTTCPPRSSRSSGKETGIQVQVTLSNNEEMISKLRATGGAGFDLAQPSQDRIFGAQQEFRIYKPLDMSKVQLDAVRAGAGRGGEEERHGRRQALCPPLRLGHRRAHLQFHSAPKSPTTPTCASRSSRAARQCASSARRSWRSRSPRVTTPSRSITTPRLTPPSWSRSARPSPPARRISASSTTTRTSC